MILDLFRKLQPHLGDKLEVIQALYLAGDDESRRTAERILSVIYTKVITGIHPPPISTGTYPLGMILSGNNQLYQFGLAGAFERKPTV
jgi:hypothetical protein